MEWTVQQKGTNEKFNITESTRYEKSQAGLTSHIEKRTYSAPDSFLTGLGIDSRFVVILSVEERLSDVPISQNNRRIRTAAVCNELALTPAALDSNQRNAVFVFPTEAGTNLFLNQLMNRMNNAFYPNELAS